MATMKSYSIFIGFKDTNLYFTRPYILRIVTSIFEVFQMAIALC